MAIITISRGTFSGGKELAECVASRLGYRLLSREVLVKAAAEFGVPLDKLSQALTDKPGRLERMRPERVHYLAYIQAALCREVQNDRIVYHGHAGHLLLRGVPHVLSVRVIANMEFRIKAAMERNNISWNEAIEFIKERDEARAKWTRFLYHVDWLDPSLYDLVINLERTSLEGACELVCLTAAKEEFQPTPESQKRLDDLLLATEVRAKIAADESIADEGIEVEAHDGIITIGGKLHSSKDAVKLTGLARQYPGVRDVELKTGAQSQPR
jgi:cytidylate kinase